MPASEIDDIFAGKTTSIKSAKAKGKEKPIPEADATTFKDKKKKKKKRKHEVGDESTERKVDGQGTSEGKKRKKKQEVEGIDGETDIAPSSAKPVPETVFDPSLTLNRGVTKPNRHNPSSHTMSEKSGKPRSTSRSKKDEGESEDIQRFKDSRGTGPRKRTEEGFLVYKEDELGIRDDAGDTPLCPFDCDCCF